MQEAATQFNERFTEETKADLMMQRYIFKEVVWEKVGARFGLSTEFMRKIYGDFLRPFGSEFESVSDGKGGKDGGRWDQSWARGYWGAEGALGKRVLRMEMLSTSMISS